MAGRNAQTRYTLLGSPSVRQPNKAAPTPPAPKARPKNHRLGEECGYMHIDGLRADADLSDTDLSTNRGE